VAYHSHLADLGLLRRIFRRIDSIHGAGDVEVERLEIMPLGKKLLDFILK
jgi:hypothetical protein